MNSIEISAKNVDQAVEIGLFKLGVTKDDVKILVLEEGGLFDKAKVRLVLKSELQNLSPAEEMVNALTEKMGLTVVPSVTESEDEILIDFAGDDIGNLIGKRGDALDALQHILNSLINKDKSREEYKRVKVDCSGYRARREATLQNLATSLADKATKANRPFALEPMNAYERKIIHLALEGRKDVKTVSENEEPNRYITIIPISNGTQSHDFND